MIAAQADRQELCEGEQSLLCEKPPDKAANFGYFWTDMDGEIMAKHKAGDSPTAALPLTCLLLATFEK